MALGAAAGVALGAVYVASPLTVWFLGAMMAIFAWAGRGLSARERRLVWGILATAVAIRVLLIVALFVVSEPNVMTSFFWDGDGVYMKRRAMTMRAFWLGMPVPAVMFSRAFDHGYGWSSYIYLLAYVQYLIGLAPFGVHLLNVAVFVASAVALYRLSRRSYGRAPALVGLILMLFFPTLIAWSVSALKESLFLFLIVLGLRAAVAAVRAARVYQRVAAWAVLAAAIAANSTVRTGAGVIMIAGLAAGCLGSFLARRVILAALFIVCLSPVASRLWHDPDVQAKFMPVIKAAAMQHRGAIQTDGNTYKLLEPTMYANEDGIDKMSPEQARSFVVRALVSFVAVPLPWQVRSRSEMVFLAQQVIWLLLVVLTPIGFVAGLRRDALLTCMLSAVAVVGAMTVAVNSGNIGSLARFRDTIVPFMIWLSALGAVSAVSEFVSRREASKGQLGRGSLAAAVFERESS